MQCGEEQGRGAESNQDFLPAWLDLYLELGDPHRGVFPGVGAPSLEEKWGTSRAYTTKDSGRQVELRPGWLFQPWLGQGEVLPPGLPLEARCCPPDPLASCCPVPLRCCQSRNQFCSCPG